MDMVRSIIKHIALFEFLQGEILKAATYILNIVLFKAMPTTPYEIYTERKLSIRHFYVLKYPAEALPYRLNEYNLHSKMVTYYFIGYSKRSNGYKYYNPNSRFFFDMRRTYFFENIEFEKGDKEKNKFFKKRCQSPLTSIDNNSQVWILDIIRSTY